MTIEIRVPTDEQFPAMARADTIAFGEVMADADIARARPTIDLSRFRVAIEGSDIVGVAGSYSFDMTLPGGTTMPVSAVTWVSVLPTHRRRGLLTQLIAAVHADTDESGEAVAILFASEGGIYERFGYGMGSQQRYVSIDRRAARLRPELIPDPTAVRFVFGDDATDHLSGLWDRSRRARAGELSRSVAWHERLAVSRNTASGDDGAAFHLAHRDGYVAYRLVQHWNELAPAHVVEIDEFVAVTPQAHLDLWHTMLGLDLVATITSRKLAVDEVLPMLLTDNRAYTTTTLRDGLWVNVRDAGVAFGARQYGTADRLVVEADGQRWAIESDGDESSCRRVRSKPDLVTDGSSFSALLLGGVRPTFLARAGRAQGSDTVLRRADAFFVTGPAPHCATHF